MFKINMTSLINISTQYISSALTFILPRKECFNEIPMSKIKFKRKRKFIKRYFVQNPVYMCLKLRKLK